MNKEAPHSTGAFSGKITLIDLNPVTHTNLPRTVSYQGLIIRTPQGLAGRGFFLLPKVPAVTGETIKNTAVLSGRAGLTALP